MTSLDEEERLNVPSYFLHMLHLQFHTRWSKYSFTANRHNVCLLMERCTCHSYPLGRWNWIIRCELQPKFWHLIKSPAHSHSPTHSSMRPSTIRGKGFWLDRIVQEKWKEYEFPKQSSDICLFIRYSTNTCQDRYQLGTVGTGWYTVDLAWFSSALSRNTKYSVKIMWLQEPILPDGVSSNKTLRGKLAGLANPPTIVFEALSSPTFFFKLT